MKEWIVGERKLGHALSTKSIIKESTLRAEAQASWCYRFMNRQRLAMRLKTGIAQKMPKNYENQIIKFHRLIINIRDMDEVLLTFDVVSNRTVDAKGSKTITTKTPGNEKTHNNVVLSYCADGIFKGNTFPKDKIP
ncbi:hypothetical protein J437_LFUL015637 [Ladona fulva]|uniref:HTH CENPB-type domain-containing protein n=1 Tax=Ladona fulva TaxID=123851 RepID=A0A8K0KKA5_LADFU|nr:hypothetical protein J437_LFUL015637 [Ladona fulva]